MIRWLLLLTSLAGLGRAQYGLGNGAARDLYVQNCGSCHGMKGDGGVGGSLIDDEWKHATTDAEIAELIHTGIPSMQMPAFGTFLKDDQIRSLVIYMRELRHMAEDRGRTRPVDGVVDSQHHRFRVETVLENPNRMWGLDFAPDGRLLVTEIDGAVRWVSKDGELLPPVEDTPSILRKGQGGMLDVALHPDFDRNGWVYLTFADGRNGQGMTSLVRGRIVENRWTDQEVLFKTQPRDTSNAGVHFGSRIVFLDDYVFFGMGDRGNGELAQRLDQPNGKIYRLHQDGRVPDDNPFVGKTPYPAIWSYGHRNPQGMALRPGTGELWETEHGPRGGDEFNRIQPGRNYGWPVITHGMNYDGRPLTDKTEQEGMEQPVWFWTPSIATCGLAFATGSAFPGWEGDAFAGGLSGQVLERLRIKDGKLSEREVILRGLGRVRDVNCAPDGTLTLILESRDSRIVRLVPVP